MGMISYLGEPYLAGHSLAEGIERIEEQFLRGLAQFGRPICSTLDILGEAASTPDDVAKYLGGYSKAIRDLGALRRNHLQTLYRQGIVFPFSVSVKPSAISLSKRRNGNLMHDVSSLETNLTTLAAIGRDCRVPVTIDMEDHVWTDATLRTAASLWEQGIPLDIVLQSCLDRTLQRDPENYLDQEYAVQRSMIGVRACRGIYREPSEIATRDPRVAKERLYQLIEKLVDLGYYAAIATHDPVLIKRIREGIIQPKEMPPTSYEIQGLRGVYVFQDVILPEALRLGETVRMYMPIELQIGDGTPYVGRRIAMNREIVTNFIRDRMGRMRRRLMGEMPKNGEQVLN